jgi:hypothetical protein
VGGDEEDYQQQLFSHDESSLGCLENEKENFMNVKGAFYVGMFLLLLFGYLVLLEITVSAVVVPRKSWV